MRTIGHQHEVRTGNRRAEVFLKLLRRNAVVLSGDDERWNFDGGKDGLSIKAHELLKQLQENTKIHVCDSASIDLDVLEVREPKIKSAENSRDSHGKRVVHGQSPESVPRVGILLVSGRREVMKRLDDIEAEHLFRRIFRKTIDEAQGAKKIRPRLVGLKKNRRTEAVADEVGRPKLEKLCQSDEIAAHGFDGQVGGIGDGLRAMVPAKIEDHRFVGRGKVTNLMMPVIHQAGDSVDENDGRPLAAHFVVDRRAVEAGEMSRGFLEGVHF